MFGPVVCAHRVVIAGIVIMSGQDACAPFVRPLEMSNTHGKAANARHVERKGIRNTIGRAVNAPLAAAYGMRATVGGQSRTKGRSSG